MLRKIHATYKCNKIHEYNVVKYKNNCPYISNVNRSPICFHLLFNRHNDRASCKEKTLYSHATPTLMHLCDLAQCLQAYCIASQLKSRLRSVSSHISIDLKWSRASYSSPSNAVLFISTVCSAVLSLECSQSSPDLPVHPPSFIHSFSLTYQVEDWDSSVSPPRSVAPSVSLPPPPSLSPGL